MCHRSIRLSVRVRAITAVAAALAAAAGPAPASVVVTETAFPQQVFWLLNLTGQQGIAHTQIVDEHDVIAVQFFTDESLAGADLVYFTGLSAHSDAEIDALVDFVDGGGRLILAADLNPLGLVATAARFGVTYGEPLFGERVATVSDFENGVTNGPAGVVESYSALVPNGGLASTNPNFEVLASYPDGQVALGYLRTGAGEVVFLTDLNTFDNDRLGLFDNRTLWTNLFAYTAVTTLDLDVKPGSCPNPLNRNSHGVIPISVLGTADFDVTTMDISSVMLTRADGVGGAAAPNEGPPGPHSVYEDTATPFEGEACGCHDLGGDGVMDLSMKFRTDDVVAALELGGLPAGAELELVVSGTLFDGTPFSGSDCVLLVPPGASNVEVATNAPGVFVSMEPADLNTEGDGFAPFERWYVSGEVIEVSAPLLVDGKVLTWSIDGNEITGTPSVVIEINANTVVEAVYVGKSVLQPRLLANPAMSTQ